MNILVTGASSGIDAAICSELVEQGYIVLAALLRQNGIRVFSQYQIHDLATVLEN